MKKLDHSKQSIIKHQLLAIKYQLTAISYQLFTFSYYLLQLLFSVPLDVMACPHLGEPPNKNCIGMLTVPLFFLGGSPSCPHLAETSSKNNTNTHTHINTHTQTQTHTHKYTHTHKSTHTHTYTHTQMYICICYMDLLAPCRFANPPFSTVLCYFPCRLKRWQSISVLCCAMRSGSTTRNRRRSRRRRTSIT